MATGFPAAAMVLYTLTGDDAETVNRRRVGRSAWAKLAHRVTDGAQLHVGNSVSVGQQYPMVIVRVWDDPPGSVNGQVLLDGTDVLWVTSVKPGVGPGTFAPLGSSGK